VLNTASQIIFEPLLGDHAKQMISHSVSTCLCEAFILEMNVVKIKSSYQFVGDRLEN